VTAPASHARHMPGEEGAWVFILGDMVVFAVFFGVIVYTRGQDPELFRASQAHLDQGLGTLNTLLLLTSSYFVARGVRAADGRGHGAAARLFGAALLCAAGFVVVKAIEYANGIDAGHTPATNDFFLYFYVFTGIHLLHVVIGAAVLYALIRLTRRAEPGLRDRTLIESGASYWHMVDLLWIALFSLLYLMV